MKNFALVLMAFAFSASAFAALPPGPESIRRIEAALSALPAGFSTVSPITRIEESQGNMDAYLITSSRCSAEIEVSCGPQTPGLVGPCPLKTKVVSARCKR